MKYSKDTYYLIHLINKSLKQAECSFSLENKNIFSIYQGFHEANHVRYDFRLQDKVEVSFWLEAGSLRIDVGGAEEAYEWTKEDLKRNPVDVHRIIKTIFCSTVKIKTRCKYHIEISFLGEEGRLLGKLNYTYGFLLLFYYWARI